MLKPTSPIGLTVLVVEDEEHIVELVGKTLRKAGFGVTTALTQAEILAQVEAKECAAIILDLGLPDADGIAITHAVRERSDIPILILTGRAGIRARVQGLESGADDYLIKPFAPEELTARLKAILRRKPGEARSGERSPKGTPLEVTLGSASLDPASGSIVGPRGEARLTTREVRLILALCHNSGSLSRDAIYREIFQREWDPNDRSLDVHVANLRRKLAGVNREDTVIGTVRGEGYELRVPNRLRFPPG